MSDRLKEPQSQTMRDAIARARGYLSYLLARCTPAQQALFARLYPEGIEELSIDCLDGALKQVEAAHAKNDAKAATHEAIRLAEGFPPN